MHSPAPRLLPVSTATAAAARIARFYAATDPVPTGHVRCRLSNAAARVREAAAASPAAAEAGLPYHPPIG